MELPVLTKENPCGECKVCCTYFLIEAGSKADFWKPMDTLCKFWDNGCSRQHDKPLVCQHYDCAYASADEGMRWESVRPDNSDVLYSWNGAELCVRVIGDKLGIKREHVHGENAPPAADFWPRVKASLEWQWIMRMAASRRAMVDFRLHGMVLATMSSTEVLEECLRHGYPVELNRQHVTELDTFACPEDLMDDGMVRTPRWQRVSADCQIHFLAYPVIFGWRLRAGFWHHRRAHYVLDWCLGDRDSETREFQYTFRALMHKINENWKAGRDYFTGIPPYSLKKPLFLDPEFVSQVFVGVPWDDQILGGPEVSDPPTKCVFESPDNPKCRCLWCGSKPDVIDRCKMTTPMREALRTWAREHGRRWKSELTDAWLFEAELVPELRQVRNSIGPSGIYRIPAHLVKYR